MARELIAFASRVAGRPINVVTDMPQIVAVCAGLVWAFVALLLCCCMSGTLLCHCRAAKQGKESPWAGRRGVGLLVTTGFLAVAGRFLSFPLPRGTTVADARPPQAAAPVLRVATFNLRGADIPDGIDAWNLTRKDLARRTLRELGAPIVGTQEGWDYQLDYLTAEGYQWVGQAAAPGHACHDSAIVYDPQAVKLLESGTFWLSPTPSVPGSRFQDSALVRTATWAIFELLPQAEAPIETVFVLNTHLDHIGEEARRQQASVILEELADLAGRLKGAHFMPSDGSPLPLVVTGDFNALRKSGAWSVFEAAGLLDTWCVTPLRVANTVLSYHGFLGTASERPFYTAPLAALVSLGSQLTDKLPFTWLPADMHIDWILTGTMSRALAPSSSSATPPPALVPVWVQVVTTSEGARYPSDHYPIVAALALSQPPQH